ncbi:MAG: lipid-A-disaccharide synthase [Deltaproteobacteria bacterium]|nr:lipid-A-disaccharide synthase [Deltaproteobacteria bacterium]
MRSEMCTNEDRQNITSGHSKRIMIVAGEASGDLHGGNLVKAMHRIDQTLQFYGVGGINLKEAGVDLVADSADMAVVGLTEVFSKLGAIRRVMGALKASIKAVRPDLLILIDYPDFNLSLARTAKKRGVKIFYYISPQVWAWRKGRIGTIKKIIDKMAVILPFEARIYHEAGVDATFVGHPLLDVVRTKYTRQEALNRFGLREGATTVGILPGSRQSEVVSLLPDMLKAAEIIMKKLPDVQFVLPLADTLDIKFMSHITEQYPVTVKIISSEIYDVIGCADVVMVASGTATLETALMETPMVIIYKVSALSYYVGKMFIHVDHIGLVNIIAGKTVVPELIQGEANPEKIAAEVVGLLTNRARMDHIRSELSKIKETLGSPGAAERAAHLAYDML